MTWEESFAGICRIVAMLRDGHTSMPKRSILAKVCVGNEQR